MLCCVVAQPIRLDGGLVVFKNCLGVTRQMLAKWAQGCAACGACYASKHQAHKCGLTKEQRKMIGFIARTGEEEEGACRQIPDRADDGAAPFWR